ncbi:MAG: N-6 DNA methylase [Candidatus Micrarchaeaceae archaeon]
MFINTVDKIRNILRSEGITGIDSINHCIGFLVIRFLDEYLCHKLNIDVKYTYNNLISTKCKNKLYEKIYNPSSSDFLVYHLVYKLNMNFLRDFKIKSVENLYNILMLFKDLNIKELNENYDLTGIIYELHLETGTNNCRDLGQYFTSRKVIKYMINLVDPKLNQTICDPTMGTGGFLTMTVKYLRQKYNINWKTYKNLIFGYDVDNDVTNLATLNLLLETGEIFDNLECKNVLTSNIDKKFDIIFANEPMGIDINYDKCSPNLKSFNIKGTCESLFMQLFMNLLNKDGKACIIVPETFLSGSKNETRKYLINNFDVRKIVHLNGKFFLNTNINAYIIYFINSGPKTQNVDFYVLDENLVENKILTVDYEKIKNNNYILIHRFYVPISSKLEYPIYKLKDICKFLPKSKRKAKYGKDVGLYPFFRSGKKVKYCDTYDYDVESIIIGTGGEANIKYGVKFSCSTDNVILTSKTQNVDIKYVYYYLKNNIDILQRGFFGTTIKHISSEYIKNIEIPLPPLDVQLSIVKKIDLLCTEIQQIENQINEINQSINCLFSNI